jgi:hypothetical protein
MALGTLTHSPYHAVPAPRLRSRATHANANRKKWCPSAVYTQTQDVLAQFESQLAQLERATCNVWPAYPVSSDIKRWTDICLHNRFLPLKPSTLRVSSSIL